MAGVGFRHWFNDVAHGGMGNVNGVSTPQEKTVQQNNPNAMSTKLADARAELSEQERVERQAADALSGNDMLKESNDDAAQTVARQTKESVNATEKPALVSSEPVAAKKSTTWDDLRNYLATEKEERKNSRKRQMIGAVGDALRHLGQLAFSGGGYANPQNIESSAAKIKAIDDADAAQRKSDFMTEYQIKKAEEAEKKQDAALARQAALDEANLYDKAWHRNFKIADYNQKAAERAAEAKRKADNDAFRQNIQTATLKQSAADRAATRSMNERHHQENLAFKREKEANRGNNDRLVIAERGGKKLVGRNLTQDQVENLYKKLVDAKLILEPRLAVGEKINKRESIARALNNHNGKAWKIAVDTGYYSEDSSARDKATSKWKKIK